MQTNPYGLLEKHFGFREFLDAQEDVVNAIVSGEDALVVMPTGGGKSLCYQLPALLLEGVTVVVSPLIALMKDQVDALQRKDIPATLINSSLSHSEQTDRIRRLAAGEYKLVYIAPERFRQRSFLQALGECTISLFAIDEAHCISQWGHDFRPDYFRLGEVLDKLGRPQCAAFTATATPEVRQDILAQLSLREPREFVAGFARPNLRLSVMHVDKEADKYSHLRNLIREQKTGIIYCATRKRVEAVTSALLSQGVKTIAYHGGLTDHEREAAQNHFINRDVDVAVATNAFGMGIDRSDIRFVAHFEVPGSLEAYYQEAGRAGRDGEPSICELYFNYADTKVQEFFISGSNPSRELILDTYELLRRNANPEGEVTLSIRDIGAHIGEIHGTSGGATEMGVSSAIGILHRAEYIERFDIAGERVRGTRLLKPEVTRHEVQIDWESLSEKERRDRKKLSTMVDFVYSRSCRQEKILRYFGELEPHRCGNCDFCVSHSHSHHREGTEEEVLIVRKALSGVARMRGRYGKGRVIQMLLGSRSREVLDARLDQLSTYGMLNGYGVSYLQDLFRELQVAGYVAHERKSGSDGRDYQLLVLTPEGKEVMQGDLHCRLSWPDIETRSASDSTSRRESRGGHAREASNFPLPQEDGELLVAMKKKRSELAKEQNVPAYVVFSDSVLGALARIKPKSIDAGRRIRGIGEVKAEKYLPEFLEVIRTHTESELV